MRQRLLIPIIFVFILTFLINFLSAHNLLTSIANSATLCLSVYLFKDYLNKRRFLFNIFIIVSFCIVPLFHYQPKPGFISLLPLLSLGFFYISSRATKKLVYLNKVLVLVWIFFLTLSISYSSEVIKPPFGIQSSQLIFNSPEINYNIKRHQQDALYIPYKIRQLIYSDSVFSYAILTNFFDFLNLKNLSDALFIANLYPLFVGFYKFFRERFEFKYLCLSAFLITILIAGIDRSPDKFQSLYLLGPVFVYLIILGLRSINKKFYILLWVLGLFILLTPKI